MSAATRRAHRSAPVPPARGPSPLLWPLLFVLSLLYRLAVLLRTAAYARGWLKPHRAACPVISVGNLAVGGSGKTPLVEYLLRESLRAGKRPVCLTRGYRGHSRAALMRVRVSEGLPADPVALGDEPAMLARRNPDVTLYVGRARRSAARLAALWDAPELIVLDDGFQHLPLARDLDLLLIDAERGLGNGRLLPLGPLREPLRAGRRADAVLITKANLGDAQAVRRQVEQALGDGLPVFTCDYTPRRLKRLDGAAERPPCALAGQPVNLVCGIASPTGFVRSVEQLGAQVATVRCYPDHHDYGSDDLEWLDAALAEVAEGADAPPRWLTTEKDAVKLVGRLRHPERLWVLEMAVVPDADARAFLIEFIEKSGIL